MVTPERPAAPSRRTPLIVMGAVAVVVGLLVAASSWVLADAQVGRSAAGLARAPVGCDTTLEFSDTGVFVLFIETRGRIDDLEGRCEAPARYDRRSDTPVEATITMFDATGRSVALSETDEVAYDADGFVGTAHREVSIGEPGRYVVRVTSDEADVVVAIGRDPSASGDALRLGGLIGGGALLAVGVILLVLGLSRRPAGEPAASVGPGSTWAGAVIVPPPVAPPPPPPAPGSVVGPPSAGSSPPGSSPPGSSPPGSSPPGPPGGGLPPPSGPPVG